MRIYNGTNYCLNFTLGQNQKLSISSHSVSGDFMATNEFISLLITSYGTDEIAFIISGAFEITQIASIPVATQYTVQSLDEAIERFTVKTKESGLNKIIESEKKLEQEVKKIEEEAKEVKPIIDDTPAEQISEELFNEAAEASKVEDEVNLEVEEPVAEEITTKKTKKSKKS